MATLGDASGRHLHALAWNRDARPVVPGREAKSIGNEETFPTDLTDRERLGAEIVRLADRVAQRLRAAGRAGRTVQLKVRYTGFRTITRSRTLPEPTDLAVDITRVARDLLDAVSVGEGVRLLGVTVQQLVATTRGSEGDGSGAPAPETEPGTAGGDQPDLFSTAPDPPSTHAALERSVDAVRARFGDGAVGPASTRVGRPGAVRENGRP